MTIRTIPIENIGLGISQATLKVADHQIHIMLTRDGDGWAVNATMDGKSIAFSKRDCTRYAAAEEAIDRLIDIYER